MNTTTNGQVRKSLAQQIDRLDNVLDGLADNLEEAVAAAVQQAVSQVMREVLSQPELLGRLQPANPWTELAGSSGSPRESKPGLGRRLKQAAAWIGLKVHSLSRTCGSTVCGIAENCLARVQGLCLAGKLRIQQVREATVTRLRRSYQILKFCGHVVRHVRRLGLPLAVALAVGGVAAFAAWQCGPLAASITSGISGFTVALAVQLVMWLRTLGISWHGLADCD